jgi:rSAM/selenodomain-associated transferase 2
VTHLQLSIVIPALGEAASIGGLLGDLRGITVPHEVIVVDGGSHDDTVVLARAAGAAVLHSAPGRGGQLRTGAAAARGRVLCFLHADVRLPRETLAALDRLAVDGAPKSSAFRLRIDGGRWSYRMVEWAANLRARLLALPYGDQGLVVDRDTYDRVGGYADVPLMEDVMFALALRAAGGIVLCRERIVVSARRWERDGVWRRSIANLVLLIRFLLGASPGMLLRRYRPEDREDDD